MTIDYLGHSGFLVETEKAVLLFDYYCGDISLIRRKAVYKPIYAFVSHVHADHFNPEIFSLAGDAQTAKFLLSFDIKGNPAIPKDCHVQFLDADQTYRLEGFGTVRTLVSTDEGVAFLIQTPDETLFHAGDLNWWDWSGEDPQWLSEQETVFKREIRKLKDIPIDAAFVVLDDRLEENFAKGMEFFLTECKADYVLPMHFAAGNSAVKHFIEQRSSGDSVLLDTSREKHWEIKKGDKRYDLQNDPRKLQCAGSGEITCLLQTGTGTDRKAP